MSDWLAEWQHALADAEKRSLACGVHFRLMSFTWGSDATIIPMVLGIEFGDKLITILGGFEHNALLLVSVASRAGIHHYSLNHYAVPDTPHEILTLVLAAAANAVGPT